jgi:hypothetical protein
MERRALAGAIEGKALRGMHESTAGECAKLWAGLISEDKMDNQAGI